jgi:segregation and condensation protein B
MSIKAKLEALVYAAEEPITLDQMAALLKDDLLALKVLPAELPPQLEQAGEYMAAEGEDSPEELAVERSLEGDVAEEAPALAEDHAARDLTASEEAPAVVEKTRSKAKSNKEKSEKVELRNLLKPILEELIAQFESEEHGIEIRQVAGGYRMSTKPEHHDVVRAFSKSLKPPIRLSLQSLETLAVIAYKQPVTVPEISDIRGVDSSGVIGTLLDRKLITTAGRKAVVGRPMLYKTTKDFLMRFGLKDVTELPSLEEFEKLAAREMQDELFTGDHSAMADATGVPHDSAADETTSEAARSEETRSEDTTYSRNTARNNGDNSSNQGGGEEQLAEDKAEAPETVTEPTVSSDPKHNKTDEQVADQIASESSGG